MKFRDAIVQSIRNYYNGELPEKSIEASDEEFIYTLEFFDEADADEEVEDNG